ncbi:MAG: tRNA pseudouridine(55) synthase TruB [Lachnospiraceae bacterium]
MDGVLNVFKEKGYTSFDVCRRLRGMLREKHIGHAGTLDPEAEGVLLVAVGRATKAIDDLTDGIKTYEAVMQLGVTTDTQDMTGKILSRAKVSATKDDVLHALHAFDGGYDQIPPMYSAIHVNGQRLYELARKGETVERAPRHITIYDVHVNDMDVEGPSASGRVRFTIECSRGTYVRTFCADVGEKLGCGAAMESLLRTRVGQYTESDALTLSQIQQAVDAGKVQQILRPIQEIYRNLPLLAVPPSFDKCVQNGGKLSADLLQRAQMTQTVPARESGAPDGRLRVFDSRGNFIGIYRKENKELVPEKMFLVGLV